MILPQRFNGPPASCNGGYAAGRLAGELGPGVVEVTLRVPPPLERELHVARTGEGVELWDGETLVAGARPGALDDVLESLGTPVGLDDARAAAARSPFLAEGAHPFPTCFGCGPQAPADALHNLAGPLGDGRYACDCRFDASLAGDDGVVAPAVVWAALDCPTSAPIAAPGAVQVLGRMTAQVLAPVRPDTEYVVVAWPLGADGRKKHAASVLLAPDGTPAAAARATWISLSGEAAAAVGATNV